MLACCMGLDGPGLGSRPKQCLRGEERRGEERRGEERISMLDEGWLRKPKVI